MVILISDPVEIPVSTTWAEEERPIDVSTSAGVTMLPMFTGSGSSQATAQLVSTNMMNKATTPGKQESKRLPMRRTNPQNGNSRRSTGELYFYFSFIFFSFDVLDIHGHSITIMR